MSQPMSPGELGALDAYRLHAIRGRLDQLYLERHSPVCDTVEGVRTARSKTLADIGVILQPEWRPGKP